MSKKTRFLLAIALPLLILLGMTIKPQATVLFGQEILLETKAYDPTDLFRGDYVALNFAISDVPKSKVDLSLDKVYNKNLYVSLKQEGKYFVVDQVSDVKPKQGVYLKGKFREGFNGFGQAGEAANYRVDYSLDKYFVEQGSGKELEQESIKGGLEGTVKVLGGYGVLTGIARR
ncbi:GDYXXLXY domain-containing protein [Desulfosporosinus youngiae]|uniref:Putative membrane-anchored protein n=1 Tax=Desulfosporosinus youngiae DSM 17734 TaxID=768710 RepID=H5Y5U4_9FIRM|nr:GDYXXLXY domain-containing protein [Desulfosporosinus youngiae]EHQ90820.1 putative membrane-anchored protein [Desulfosporosinus youngiae DSM 17734]